MRHVSLRHVDDPINDLLTRRTFLGQSSTSIGTLALAGLLNEGSATAAIPTPAYDGGGLLGRPHFAPKAKRVIFICQSGGVSQFETFDAKRKLTELHGQPMPESLTAGQRLAQIRGKKLVVCGSPYKFAKYGQSGAEISELLPYTSLIVDDTCIVRTCVTEAINHDSAVTFLQCGNQQPGRPTMGAWLSYGLGSVNQDLPAFVVLASGMDQGQNLHTRYWGNGFLPAQHQGVMFRGGSEPVLFVTNPQGVSRAARRRVLDGIRALNEMAYRMQMSAPELMDISDEPQHILDMYGPEVTKPGTAAACCLLARRMAQRDVRFIQLYHRGWDQHGNLPNDITRQCRQTDQPSAALIKDLRQHGLLDDTLVIWGTEFGRSPMLQGEYNPQNYGRDHHMLCFTMWMAGGGIKEGVTIGESDEFGYQPAKDLIHMHDLHATWLHLLGIDHKQLTYSFQGRDFRLTDVHGNLLPSLLA